MVTGPKLTGPVERLGTFRHFLNADTGSAWNVATTAAMVALANVTAGDRVYVGDANRHQWFAIPAATLPVSADCLNGTGSSVQYLRHGIQLASETVNGLMTTTQVIALNGLRNSRFKAASVAAMQAITTAQVGDDCVVSTSTADSVWLAVTKAKYPYGANCVSGDVAANIDWFQPINVTGTVDLVAGHAFVAIPGLAVGSVALSITYTEIVGESGTLSASVTIDGVDITSTAGEFDNSTVLYTVGSR